MQREKVNHIIANFLIRWFKNIDPHSDSLNVWNATCNYINHAHITDKNGLHN